MEETIQLILKKYNISYLHNNFHDNKQKLIHNKDISCLIKYKNDNFRFHLQSINIFTNINLLNELSNYNLIIDLFDHPYSNMPKNMHFDKFKMVDKNNILLKLNNLSINISDIFVGQTRNLFPNNGFNKIIYKSDLYVDHQKIKDNYINYLNCFQHQIRYDDEVIINTLCIKNYGNSDGIISLLNKTKINQLYLQCNITDFDYNKLTNINKNIHIFETNYLYKIPSCDINNVNIFKYWIWCDYDKFKFNINDTLLKHSEQKLHIINIKNLYILSLNDVIEIIEQLNNIKNNNELFIIFLDSSIENNYNTLIYEFYERIDYFVNVYNIKLLFKCNNINSTTKKYYTLMDILHFGKKYPINLFI